MLTTETAIVTGASQGIGASLVTRFLEKGFNVVGNSRAISASTNLTPSQRLALVDGDIGDSATAQKIFIKGHYSLTTNCCQRIPARIPLLLLAGRKWMFATLAQIPNMGP
jgi:NAD(P)-dependent dehydrogenase (short-subunit alcohol dehydrogenase family)